MRLRLMSAVLLAVMVVGIAAVAVAQQDPRQREVTVRLRGVTLREALDILLRDTGLTYQLPRDIEGERVTVDLESLPLEQALYAILASQGLTYVYLPEARLYSVERIPESASTGTSTATITPPELPPTPPVTVTPPPTASLPPATSSNVVTRVINLRYADAGEIAAAFGGQVAQGAFQGQPGYGGYGYPGFYGGYRGGYSYGPYGGSMYSGYGQPYGGSYYGGYSQPYGYGGYYGGYGVNWGPPAGTPLGSVNNRLPYNPWSMP
jgi:hypothetical protein